MRLRRLRPVLRCTGVVMLFALACQSPAYAPSQAERGTPGAPATAATYGLGRPVSHDEIGAWDIDVMADGTGLPEGRGTALEGRALYEARCESCHGLGGKGGPFDVLVGRIRGDGFPFGSDPDTPRTIGNYWPWATTIFDYTRRAMPLDRPGSLTDDEVYALTAYLLFLNGLLREDRVLDRALLPTIVMPARGRFFPDDRKGGPEVR